MKRVVVDFTLRHPKAAGKLMLLFLFLGEALWGVLFLLVMSNPSSSSQEKLINTVVFFVGLIFVLASAILAFIGPDTED